MNEWHVTHPGNLAVSGVALLTIEATAVVPEGRISYGDVGLWDDRTELALARVVDGVRRWAGFADRDPVVACRSQGLPREVPWRG